MMDQRLFSPARDSNHVKSRLSLVQPVLAHKEESRLNHLALLVPGDRLQRGAEPIPGTGLDLHKNNDLAIEDDEIQLAHGAPIVPFHDPIAFFLKIGLGNPLPFFSDDLVLTLRLHGLRKSGVDSPAGMLTQISRTGLKLFRWMGNGPYRFRAFRWEGLP